MTLKLLCASLLTVFIFSGSFAQTDPDTINFQEIVVTANRVEVNKVQTPVSISVISSELIESQEESNILPVVARITPSVFISEIGAAGYAMGNGTSGQLSIRGISGSPNSRVLMLVDGQPQFMGIFGHPLPNFHTAANVEKVEIIRGPASLLYGSNAMGGVINVISKQETNNGVHFSGNAGYGSFNTIEAGASLTYSKDKISAGVRFNYDKTDGHRDSSAFHIANIHAFADYTINDNWKANIGYTLADYSFQDPGVEANPDVLTFSGDITRHMLTTSLKNTFATTRGGLYVFYSAGRHEFSDGWLSDDVNYGLNAFQSVDAWKGSNITAGIDFKQYGGEASIGFLADTFLLVNETAGYLLADQEIASWATLNIGGRYEYNSKFGPEFIPQAGLTVRPMKGTVVKALASKGFRSPTIMEMYLFAPNSELGPESLWNYELSWGQHFGKKARVEVTGYYIDGTDMIVVRPNTEPGPPMIRQNSGTFTNFGFEVESALELTNNIELMANYSLLESDTKLYLAPAHQFYLGGIYTLKNFIFSLNIKAVSGLYTRIDPSDASNDIKESYALLNGKIRYNMPGIFSVYVSGKNLLNQDYQTVYGYTMPGANFMLGCTFDIN